MKNEHKRAILQGNIKKYRLLGRRDGIEYCRTAATFAAHIGLNVKTYKNYESGTAFPDYGNLVKIAAALGLPSMDLLFDYRRPVNDNIRFFLDSLGIVFRTNHADDSGKEYVLELPASIKNDLWTGERMSFDISAAEVKIYESAALRWKYDWFGRGKICFMADDFPKISAIYHEHEARLKSFVKYPFIRQLLFLGLVKAYADLTVGDPSETIDAELKNIVSFLQELETFVADIRKAADSCKEKEIENWFDLQDKMNDELHSEQLREIFLDMLSDIRQKNGRGGIKIIRQRLQNKK